MPGSGQQISDVDRGKIDKKFLCSNCDLLLVEPMQTLCGHLMCKSCVQRLKSSDNPTCPKDGTLINESNVFPDRFTERELVSLKLHCLNSECDWFGSGNDLQNHVNTCNYALIKCVHTKCTTEIKRLLLAQHLKDECLYRSVRCENCHETLPFAAMEEHVDSICEDAPVRCKHCGENILRKDIKRHEKELCKEVPTTCDFQAVGCSHNQTLKRSQLNRHMEEGLKNHVRLLLQYLSLLATQLSNYIPRPEFTKTIQKIRDDITDVRSGSAEKFVMLVGKLTGLERRIEAFESNEGRVHSYNGTLLWKIEGYQRKRQDAINGVKTALYSPPFYSAQFGYKMCAKIYMNGDGTGKDSHLSLFFVVMRGDYDALQTWPFQKKITMMLLDQGNGEHVIDTLHSDPQSSSFQRPTSDMNIQWGCPSFMALGSLNNHQYIKDDVMFIKVIVE